MMSADDTSGSIYDDVFRTMVNDCPELLLPVLNETFGENYTGKETIEPAPNEHFVNQQDGKEQKRVTDSCFVVHGQTTKKYHLECQSEADTSMLVRIVEYDMQIALDAGKVEGNQLTICYPHSGVLFLRSAGFEENEMQVHILTPGGKVSYDIAVMKLQQYGKDEIIKKRLLFLLPFYLFAKEKQFAKISGHTEELEALKQEYRGFVDSVSLLFKAGRNADAVRAAEDKEFQAKLLAELLPAS